MELLKTVVCKLDASDEAGRNALNATLVAFANACNHVLGVSLAHETTAQFPLHKLTYRDVRETYGLTANLAVRAIARVAASFGRNKRPPKAFQPTSIDYDARIFSFREADWTVSLSTINGRYRFPMILGDYQRRMLTGQSPASATLVKRGADYFLHVQVKIPYTPKPSDPDKVIGVDRGINAVAVSSTGKHFDGRRNLHERRSFLHRRARLQAKGTKSARRRLRRLSGKEQRWMTLQNHIVSKSLIQDAQHVGATTIALEDLKGIRTRIRSKACRRLVSVWNFFQLEQFLTYKANEQGIAIVKVDPAYTSQTCSRCGHVLKSQRCGHRFLCVSCGYENHADLNAAFNIRDRHVLSLLGSRNAPVEVSAAAGG